MNYSVVCIQIGTDGIVLRSGETDFSVKPNDARVCVCLFGQKGFRNIYLDLKVITNTKHTSQRHICCVLGNIVPIVDFKVEFFLQLQYGWRQPA